MDIAKCHQLHCGIRNRCHRFLAPAAGYQSWIAPVPVGTDCYYFLPVESMSISAFAAPSDQEIETFYRQWFEENFCIPPSAKAAATATLAIKAAFERFLPSEGSAACSL